MSEPVNLTGEGALYANPRHPRAPIVSLYFIYRDTRAPGRDWCWFGPPDRQQKQCGNVLGEDHGQESWGSGAQPDQITQGPVASNSWNGEMNKGKMAMIPGTLFASCAMFQLHLRVPSADLCAIYLNGVQCLNSGCNLLSFYRLLNNSTETRQSQTKFYSMHSNMLMQLWGREEPRGNLSRINSESGESVSLLAGLTWDSWLYAAVQHTIFSTVSKLSIFIPPPWEI